MERLPKPGEFYRHYKGGMYQIIAVAHHFETGECLVICQALFGNFAVYAEPLSEFNRRADNSQYPGGQQRFCFEIVDKPAVSESAGSQVPPQLRRVPPKPQRIQPAVSESAGSQVPPQPRRVPSKPQRIEPAVSEHTGGQAQPNPWLMRFLDAKDNEEKYNLLVSMRDDISDRLIDDLAVVLDVVIPEGDLFQRYDQLKLVLRTRQRYEISDRR